MKTLWHQTTTLHPSFEKLDRSLEEDWFILPHELRLQSAHARALHAAGLLQESELGAVEQALGDIEQEFLGGPCPESDAEDIHTWMESELSARAGDAGQRVHAGRSRNDQVATLLVLYLIDAGSRLQMELRELIRTLATRAEEWADLQMPLQTHAQFAAPGSVGAWALRYAVAFGRQRRSLAFHLAEWSAHCPLGSGAVAGSSLPIDRALQAHALGFDGPSENALYSTGARDECVEALAWIAQTALHLAGFATDVLQYAQTPFAWVEYPRSFGTGSSMMPNKVNPDAMELVRGHSASLLAVHHEALLLLKGLPSGYSRDLQCIKPLVRSATERASDCIRLVSAFVADLQFDADRVRAALAQGHIAATLAMEEKVLRGDPLRHAHSVVAKSLDSTDDVTPDAHAYRTIGSASPEETRRVARGILAEG